MACRINYRPEIAAGGADFRLDPRLVIMTIEPLRCTFMIGNTACVSFIVPSTLTSKGVRQVAWTSSFSMGT